MQVLCNIFCYSKSMEFIIDNFILLSNYVEIDFRRIFANIIYLVKQLDKDIISYSVRKYEIVVKWLTYVKKFSTRTVLKTENWKHRQHARKLAIIFTDFSATKDEKKEIIFAYFNIIVFIFTLAFSYMMLYHFSFCFFFAYSTSYFPSTISSQLLPCCLVYIEHAHRILQFTIFESTTQNSIHIYGYVCVFVCVVNKTFFSSNKFKTKKIPINQMQ